MVVTIACVFIRKQRRKRDSQSIFLGSPLSSNQNKGEKSYARLSNCNRYRSNRNDGYRDKPRGTIQIAAMASRLRFPIGSLQVNLPRFDGRITLKPSLWNTPLRSLMRPRPNSGPCPRKSAASLGIKSFCWKKPSRATSRISKLYQRISVAGGRLPGDF